MPESVLDMSLLEQDKLQNQWRRERLESILPELMAKEKFDMWIVVTREDNEDPVATSLLPPILTGDSRIVLPPTGNRAILVFYRRDDNKLERLLLSTLRVPELYENVWDSGNEEQWACLARIVRERSPERIGINISKHFPHADGLTYSEYQALTEALGAKYSSRLSSAEGLVVAWLEQRTRAEMQVYPPLIALGHTIIAEAFSSAVVKPGQTSIEDVAWWMWQKLRNLGLKAWFRPMVALNRPGGAGMQWQGVIEQGDLLFCDLGLEYLGLTTDTQRQAYVLRAGESAPPPGLSAALATCNRVQDIVLAECKPGMSGNEILKRVRRQAAEAQIEAYFNLHPVGVYGHGPGAPVGIWTCQQGVPGRGEYPVADNSCYALELCVVQSVSEWSQSLTLNLEETVAVQDGKMQFFADRQSEFHLI